MKKLILGGIVAAGLVGLFFAFAHATAGGAAGGKKAQLVPVDGNGRQWGDLRPNKVFSIINSATATIVKDNDGSTPKTGILTRVCVSSGTNSEYAVVFDSAGIASVAASNTSYLMTPAINRSTNAMTCQDFNTEFTSGLVGICNSVTGSLFLYWKPNGGSN